jgi:hypothetical protein
VARRSEEDEVDLSDLLKRIRGDAKYQTFKRIVETATKRLTIDKDRDEVLALHAARQSRKLFVKKMYNPSSLMDAAANDMQARSRIVEIRVKASYQIEVVEKAMEAIQDHVTTQYSSDLNKYRNETQRKALVRRVQRVANNLITDGKDLLSLCDAFIGDIDKASYHLSNLTELTKQLAQSVGGKVI